ncbi:MAG: hypothetical protein ABI729_07760 [Chitinophagales bacterium]
MALLRLALIGLCACGQAGAQPTAPSPAPSGITAPAGWAAQPEIAQAVRDATKAEGVTVDGVEAWGETARGCYAVWFALAGSGATADAVIAGLAAEKLATSNVVKPESGDGITAVTFAKPPYTGRLRVRTIDGKLTGIACFANEREPMACDAPCTSLLGAIP